MPCCIGNFLFFFGKSDIWNMCLFWVQNRSSILFRYAMEDLLRALAILILLRCGNVRLAPLFRSWKDVDMEDLFDLHYVMCCAARKEKTAADTLEVIRCICTYIYICTINGFLLPKIQHS